MSQHDSFDFWYALENTHILQTPTRALETFGTTRIQYHLITEVMDSVNQVRVREGTLHAGKPQILTPQHMQGLPIEGFDDEQSERFMQWLQANKPDLRLLQYGFQISKQDVNDIVLHEPMETVQGNVLEEVERSNEPFSAVLTGVEQPWEVCLLKLMVDLVEKSMPQHVNEFQQRNLLPNPNRVLDEIESEFTAAEQNPSRLPYLQKVLKARNVFEQYEDRFFALVRRVGS